MIEQTLVLGLGNILCGDDGVGVRVVERLQTARSFPADIRILDGGTLGLDLLPYVREADRLLIVDSMEMNAAPGTVVRRCDDEVDACLVPKLSPHQMGLRDLLGAARLCGYRLNELILWGVQPGDLRTGLELSAPVAASIDAIVSAVLSELNLQESRLARSAASERSQPYHLAHGDSPVAPP